MLCFLAVSRSLGLFDHAEPLSLSAQHGRALLDSCPFLISLSLCHPFPVFSLIFLAFSVQLYLNVPCV